MPLFIPFVLVSWENQQILESLFLLLPNRFLLCSLASGPVFCFAGQDLSDTSVLLMTSNAVELLVQLLHLFCNKGLFGHGSV